MRFPILSQILKWASSRPAARKRVPRSLPRLERLEDRTLLTAGGLASGTTGPANPNARRPRMRFARLIGPYGGIRRVPRAGARSDRYQQ